MLILSFVLIILSILLSNNTKKHKIINSIGLFLLIFLTNIYLFSNYFTGKGIDESIIYHLRTGLKGAGIWGYNNIIAISIIILIIGFFAAYYNYTYSKKIFNLPDNKYIISLSHFLLILAFIFNPAFINIMNLNGYYLENLNLKNSNNINFKDEYYIPNFEKANEKNKNLIFIYLESFENLYLDENLFPGLSKGINELKKESIYFDNIKEFYGASWTVGGMAASQCGMPVELPNSLDGIEYYMSEAICMGDFLKNAGYNLSYIGGSSLDFAAKGSFYESHGFNSVEGKEELIKYMKNQNYFYEWGLYDDTMFDFAYDRYEKLASKNEKFGLFLINMDTHGDKGVISKKCSNLKYNNDKDSILNSYYCSDYLLSDFIKKIRANKNFKNTNIVLATDHLALYLNNSVDILDKKRDQRKLLFMILDSNNTKYKEVNKSGTTLDIGPTVLSSIGFDIKQFGLGYNLFNSNSLIDKYPKLQYYKWKKNFQSFWKK